MNFMKEFVFLIKLIKNFFILIGMLFVILCILLKLHYIYTSWEFNIRTSLRIMGDAFTTSIIIDTDKTTIGLDEVIFPESVCFCRIENNHIIAISNLKIYTDNAILLTKELEFGIYNYVNKTKRNLNQEDFYSTVKKEFPLTYNVLTKYKIKNFFCANYYSGLPFIGDDPVDCEQLKK